MPEPSIKGHTLRRIFVTATWLSILFACSSLAARTRNSSFAGEALFHSYGEVAGAIVAFAFAGNALVRVRGFPDRVPVIIGISVLACGAWDSLWAVWSYHAGTNPRAFALAPAVWFVPRAALVILILVALEWECRAADARPRRRQLLYSLALIGAVFYFTATAVLAVSRWMQPRATALIPRPWDFFLAIAYLAIVGGFWRRRAESDTALERALWVAAVCGLLAELAMSQSARPFDLPSLIAHLLKDSSYAILLGGSLLENARLFRQVSELASTDSLTGLANYRRLVEIMRVEIQRSGRTGRPFAMLLLDMDGLKAINDRFGHLTGSLALKRLARILQNTCRSGDTAARYGGDEFALVLPETGEASAKSVAERIGREIMADQETPNLSASIGLAVFPIHGSSAEQLLHHADEALYQMKSPGSRRNRRTTLGIRKENNVKGTAAIQAHLFGEPSHDDSEKWTKNRQKN